MTKRTYALGIGVLALVVVAGGAGWLAAGGNINSTAEQPATDEPEIVTDAPDEVEQMRPLAEEFYQNITAYYPDARVFITQQGRIAVEVSPNADSGEGVRSELSQIALRYSAVVNETGYNSTTLSIVTGEVEMVAPGPAVEAHASGDLEDEAYLETTEVRSVERANRTASD